MSDLNGTMIHAEMSELLRILQKTLSPIIDGVADINNRLTRIEANVTGDNGRLPRLEYVVDEHETRLKALENTSHLPASCPLKSSVDEQGKTVNWLKWLAVGLIACGGLLGWEIHVLLSVLPMKGN
jgi:hypothetical protein